MTYSQRKIDTSPSHTDSAQAGLNPSGHSLVEPNLES